MKKKNGNVNRRNFFRKATSAAFAFTIIPGHIFSDLTYDVPDSKEELSGLGVNSREVGEKPKVSLIKLPVNFGAAMENTPFIFGDRPY